MNLTRRHRFFAGLAVLLAVLASACSSGGGEATPTPTRQVIIAPTRALPTATVAPAQAPAAVPEGWEAFAQGPYAGAARPDWTVIYTSEVDIDTLKFPPEFPATMVQRLAQEIGSGNLRDVLFILLDYDATFPTTMIASYCTIGNLETSVSTTAGLIAYYRAQGVPAEVVGQLTYRDDSYDIIKPKLTDATDSYQVYLHTSNCYHAITVSTRPGETGVLDELRAFAASFSVNADGLRTIAER